MDEAKFRAFAATRLKPNAVNSYLANCRHAERVIDSDLDSVSLHEPGIRAILRKLADAGTPSPRVSDCGSALRMYAKFKAVPPSTPAGQTVVEAPLSMSATPGASQAAVDLTHRRARDLLVLHTSVIDELRRRGIARTGNGPIGDYAETLFGRAFGWTLASNSMAGHDAIDDAGIRYQIKARRVTPTNPSRQLGAIRRLPAIPFDMLAAVLFDQEFEVIRAVLIPIAMLTDVAKPVAHTNSWRVMLSDRLLESEGVVNVSEAIRIAHRVI